MKQYLDLLQHIKDNGTNRTNGTDKWDPSYQEGVTESFTRGTFGHQIRCNLQDGFPLLTTKKVYRKAVVYELLWLISWSTNIQYLCQNGIRIWDDRPFAKYKKSEAYNGEDLREFAKLIAEDDNFAAKRWDLWSVYGQSWRAWPCKDGSTVDQLWNAIDRIKNNPNSRRIVIVARNPEYAHSWWDIVAPPPCHTLFQFFVADGKLSCQLYQRSADVFLWVPFNIASYALLTHMVAQVTWLEVWDFVHTFWDVHIYNDHFKQVDTQLERDPRPLPTIKLNKDITHINDFTPEDIILEDYDPHPLIKARVSL